MRKITGYLVAWGERGTTVFILAQGRDKDGAVETLETFLDERIDRNHCKAATIVEGHDVAPDADETDIAVCGPI